MSRGANLLQEGRPLAAVIAGIVMEAVSVLFIAQSTKAQQLMTEFFDKLRIDRKLDESLNLVDAIADTGLQGKVQALMALQFVETSDLQHLLQEILREKASE